MTEWTKQYNNDTGPDDDYFEEWFEVTNGRRTFRCEESEDADFLLSVLAQPDHEPWSRVSIGVDVTVEGAHVIGIYGMTDDTSQIFHAKFYPAPQRTWVWLTDEEMQDLWDRYAHMEMMRAIEAKLKEMNT